MKSLPVSLRVCEMKRLVLGPLMENLRARDWLAALKVTHGEGATLDMICTPESMV